MEITFLMVFGFASVVILVSGLYAKFIHKGSNLSGLLKTKLKPPIGKGTRLIFMGENGVHYDSKISDGNIYKDRGSLDLENGIHLTPVELKENIKFPLTWNNLI